MKNNEKQPEIYTTGWLKSSKHRLFTDSSTLASSAIGGAFAGASLCSLIAPGPGTLIGAAVGGIGGATLINLLSKREYNKRKNASSGSQEEPDAK